MSEAVQWRYMPWEWQRAPEWWVEKMRMYFAAKAEVMPILAEKYKRRAQQG